MLYRKTEGFGGYGRRTAPSVRMWKAYGYMAEGVLGQHIVVTPSKELVTVRVANQTGQGMDLVKFLTMILGAVTGPS